MYCNKCKKSFNDDLKYCIYCGEELTKEKKENIVQKNNNVSNNNDFYQNKSVRDQDQNALAGLLVFVILGLIILFIVIGNSISNIVEKNKYNKEEAEFLTVEMLEEQYVQHEIASKGYWTNKDFENKKIMISGLILDGGLVYDESSVVTINDTIYERNSEKSVPTYIINDGTDNKSWYCEFPLGIYSEEDANNLKGKVVTLQGKFKRISDGKIYLSECQLIEIME